MEKGFKMDGHFVSDRTIEFLTSAYNKNKPKALKERVAVLTTKGAVIVEIVRGAYGNVYQLNFVGLKAA